MKIAILTFHRADNYGAVLQNYALLEAVKTIDNGNTVETLDYRNEEIEAPYRFHLISRNRNLVNAILITGINLINAPHKFAKRKVFSKFRNEKLCLSKQEYTTEQLIENEPQYDLFITGSDQIWNNRIVHDNDGVYALSFVKKARKISYAASSGTSKQLSECVVSKVQELDEISVREAELRTCLQSKIGRPVQLVVDPTFLLSKSQWNAVVDQSRLVEEPYIFMYSVSEKTPDVVKIANEMSVKLNCCVVTIGRQAHIKKSRAISEVSPLDFIRLIRDAEYVIVSSFHGLAFSVIYQNRFICVTTKNTGSRMRDLVENYGLKNCLFETKDDFDMNFVKDRQIYPANFTTVREQLRMQSMSFLYQCVNQNEN